jgi:hypothetical protein
MSGFLEAFPKEGAPRWNKYKMVNNRDAAALPITCRKPARHYWENPFQFSCSFRPDSCYAVFLIMFCRRLAAAANNYNSNENDNPDAAVIAAEHRIKATHYISSLQ